MAGTPISYDYTGRFSVGGNGGVGMTITPLNFALTPGSTSTVPNSRYSAPQSGALDSLTSARTNFQSLVAPKTSAAATNTKLAAINEQYDQLERDLQTRYRDFAGSGLYTTALEKLRRKRASDLSAAQVAIDSANASTQLQAAQLDESSRRWQAQFDETRKWNQLKWDQMAADRMNQFFEQARANNAAQRLRDEATYSRYIPMSGPVVKTGSMAGVTRYMDGGGPTRRMTSEEIMASNLSNPNSGGWGSGWRGSSGDLNTSINSGRYISL